MDSLRQSTISAPTSIYNPAYLPRSFMVRPGQVIPPDCMISQTVIGNQLATCMGKNGPINTVGLTILNIGFFVEFSIPCVVVLSSISGHALGLDVLGLGSPVVILEGTFRDIATDQLAATTAAEATAYINGGRSGIELLQHRRQIRATLGSTTQFRPPLPSPDAITYGQSIGLKEGPEGKGSAGVILTPVEDTSVFLKGKQYLLTAGHVLNIPTIRNGIWKPLNSSEAIVVTPGKLDIARELLYLEEEKELDSPHARDVLRAANTTCGLVMAGRIGADDQGWREDWGLIELAQTHHGRNGALNPETLSQLHELTEAEGIEVQDDFDGRVTGITDLENGYWPCVKYGATTGWTTARVSGESVELFLKGTAVPISGEDLDTVHPTNIVRAKVLLASREAGGIPAAGAGDSGAPIFTIDGDCSGFQFGGMLVSIFKPTKQEDPGMFMIIPQSRIFTQIAAQTGVKWSLAQ
ncbi:hypothetical protein DFH27DRAFT_93569 [Peziza echinospora]|nr:hypothetical protein DFH27DRAFT_93569 [Peziza echinospora]